MKIMTIMTIMMIMMVVMILMVLNQNHENQNFWSWVLGVNNDYNDGHHDDTHCPCAEFELDGVYDDHHNDYIYW